MWIVIEAVEQGGTRALSSPEALSSFEARGYVAIGVCSDPARRPYLSDDEQAAADAVAADRLAALAAPVADVVADPPAETPAADPAPETDAAPAVVAP